MARRGRGPGRLGGGAGILALAVVGGLVVSACSTVAEGAATPPPSPPTTPTPTFHAGADRPPQAYDASLSRAIDDLRAFWSATQPKLYGHPSADLKGGVVAVYAGQQNVPGCGTPRTAYADIAGNAFYCPDADFLAFDDNELFPQIAE